MKCTMQTCRVGTPLPQARSFATRQPRASIIVAASKAEELQQMAEYKAKLKDTLAVAAKPSAAVAAGAKDPTSADAQASLPDITAEEFWAVVKRESKSRPVMIDVFTAYCGPCKAIAPKLVQWQEEFGEDKIKIYKFEAKSSNKALGKELKVTSVPAFIFFKNGVEVNRMTGANFDKVEAMMKAEAGI